MASNMPDLNGPSDSGLSSDSDEYGAAQGNSKATKNVNKKVVGAGGTADGEENETGQSKIQQKITERLLQNSLVLSLSN